MEHSPIAVHDNWMAVHQWDEILSGDRTICADQQRKLLQEGDSSADGLVCRKSSDLRMHLADQFPGLYEFGDTRREAEVPVVSTDEADERRARLSVESHRISGDGASSSSLWVENGSVSISIHIVIIRFQGKTVTPDQLEIIRFEVKKPHVAS
jgi:hypothetical protein